MFRKVTIVKDHSVYNDVDVLRESEEIVANGNTDVDLSPYISRYGDSMTGILNLKDGIRFNGDASEQYTAFTDIYKNKIDVLSSNDVSFNKLHTNELYFSDNTKQVTAYTLLKDQSLTTNTDKLIIHDVSINELTATTNTHDISINKLETDINNQQQAIININDTNYTQDISINYLYSESNKHDASISEIDTMIYTSNNNVFVESNNDVHINSGNDVYINGTKYGDSTVDLTPMQIQIDSNTTQINNIALDTQHVTSSVGSPYTNIPHITNSSITTADLSFSNGSYQSTAFTSAIKNQITTNTNDIQTLKTDVFALQDSSQKYFCDIPFGVFEFTGIHPVANSAFGSYDHSYLADIGSQLYSQFPDYPYFSANGSIINDFGTLHIISKFNYNSAANLNAYIYMVKISYVIEDSNGTIIYYGPEIGHRSSNTPSILYSNLTYENSQYIKYISWWSNCKIKIRSRIYIQLPGFGSTIEMKVQVVSL